jgi:voltage-gated potassium channel
MTDDGPLTRVQAWERKSAGAAFVLAILYLIAWSFVVLGDTFNETVRNALLGLMVLIWLAFIADFIYKLSITTSGRWRYIVSHPLDSLAVVFPFLRPVAQLTHITWIPFFQRRAGSAQRLRILIVATAFVIVFVYSISLAVFNVERNARGANIETFGDSIWWACVTLFTVGYGDYYPVTVLGRIFAVLLMVGGLAIIGVATAVVGSYLTDRIRIQRDAQQGRGEDA